MKVKHPLASCNHAQNGMINNLPNGLRSFYRLLFSYSNASFLFHTVAKTLPEYSGIGMVEYIKKLMGEKDFLAYQSMVNDGFIIQNNKREIHNNDRDYIFERDGYKCIKPGCNDTENLTVDHIVPIVHGGTNTIDNYQTLCNFHNQEKKNRVIDYRPIKEKK